MQPGRARAGGKRVIEMRLMKWKVPQLIPALALGVASACGGVDTSTSDTALDETSSDTLESTLDGVEGVGPRPMHALLRTCGEIEVPAGLLVRDRRGPDGDRPGRGDGRDGSEHAGGRGHGGPPREGRGPRGGGREHDGPHREAGSSTTSAERPEGRGRGRGGLGRLAWVYDTNGDGTLDATEAGAFQADLVAGCEARNAALLSAHDTDGDGALSDAELEAAQQAIDAEHAARRAAAIATYDTDGDGELSRDEREAMRAARRAGLLASYDTDGDGELSDTERSALAEAIKAQLRAGQRPGHGR
jgi:hypothetical protein